jgi:hypothetical protein
MLARPRTLPKGVAAFQLLRHHRNEPQAFLYAFDLLVLNGADLRREPIEVRKATLASILRKSAAEQRDELAAPHSIVGDGEQGRWRIEAEHPGGLRVDDKLEFGRLRNWQIRRVGPFEDAPTIDADLAHRIGQARTVTDQSADVGVVTKRIAGIA